MRIAQIAPLAERIPPKFYGGTELVVSLLTEELVKRGHEVTLFASGDSITKAHLVSSTPHALRTCTDIPIRRWAAYDIRLLFELERQAKQFDIIHNHMGWQALPFLARLGCPTITTNHNPIKDYCKEIYFACGKLPYTAISNAYRKVNYPDRLNYVATVYNGIDVAHYWQNPACKRTYLLFIGRICQDKGTASAIDIAKRLNMPLKIAGKVDIADNEYFQQHVRPHLDDPQIEFIGEVNFDQKVSLYNQAAAVLYPIEFDEPFGLVMAESLAAGTPVVALNRGAVKEVLLDGKTAVIGETVDELVERFSEIEKISRDDCHDRAAKFFSKETMTNQYEAMYKDLIAHHPVKAAAFKS